MPDSFIIYVRDAHGEVVKQEITVTINGTNHGPEVVPGEHALNVVEDVTVSQEGNLNDIIKDDEAALGGLTQDARGLHHLHHERTLALRQIVRSAHAGEDAIAQAKLRRPGRTKEPICARRQISAVWRSTVDLPAILGPVISKSRLSSSI